MDTGSHIGPRQRATSGPQTQREQGDTVQDVRLGDETSTTTIDPASLAPRLVAVTDSRVSVHPLPMPRATIGTSADNDVVLEHASVSGHHAEVAWNGAGWTVRDLGSTNGTRVGLIPVTEARPLVNAAHLIVGDLDLLFLHGGDEGAIAARELVDSLRRRGGLNRRQARQALQEHALSGRSIEEILLERRLLGPGSLYEIRHDALQGTLQEEPAHEPAAVTWWLLAAALGAIAWLLLR